VGRAGRPWSARSGRGCSRTSRPSRPGPSEASRIVERDIPKPMSPCHATGLAQCELDAVHCRDGLEALAAVHRQAAVDRPCSRHLSHAERRKPKAHADACEQRDAQRPEHLDDHSPDCQHPPPPQAALTVREHSGHNAVAPTRLRGRPPAGTEGESASSLLPREGGVATQVLLRATAVASGRNSSSAERWRRSKGFRPQ
jgi:hypothetical protein